MQRPLRLALRGAGMTDERIDVEMGSTAMRGLNTNNWCLSQTRRLNATPHHHNFPYRLGSYSFDDGCVLVVFDPARYRPIPHGPLPHTVSS